MNTDHTTKSTFICGFIFAARWFAALGDPHANLPALEKDQKPVGGGRRGALACFWSAAGNEAGFDWRLGCGGLHISEIGSILFANGAGWGHNLGVISTGE